MDPEHELAAEREAGIAKALEVTRMLSTAGPVLASADAAITDLNAVVQESADARLKQVTATVEATMAKLSVLLSRAASNCDEDEFEKVRSAIEHLSVAAETATEQAREEALSADTDVDVLLKTNDVAAEAAGMQTERRATRRMVEDAVVLVVDGRPVVYDWHSMDWVPLPGTNAGPPPKYAHVLSGHRVVAGSDRLHATADGAYCVTSDHVLCRVDRDGTPRPLPGKLKGTCLIRLGDHLLAVATDGALHSLDLEGDGRWRLAYDQLRLTSAAVAGRSLVVATADGRVLHTVIDGDLDCLNQFTPWTEMIDTDGLRVTAVGSRAPDGMILRHPDGRVAKLSVDPRRAVALEAGDDDLIVRVSRPQGLWGAEQGYVALDVQSGPCAGVDALMHEDYKLFARPFRKRDFAYAWKLVGASEPGTYFLYNDFAANSWLGYDVLHDELAIVNEDSEDRVAWTVTPDPGPEAALGDL